MNGILVWLPVLEKYILGLILLEITDMLEKDLKII